MLNIYATHQSEIVQGPNNFTIQDHSLLCPTRQVDFSQTEPNTSLGRFHCKLHRNMMTDISQFDPCATKNCAVSWWFLPAVEDQCPQQVGRFQPSSGYHVVSSSSSAAASNLLHQPQWRLATWMVSLLEFSVWMVMPTEINALKVHKHI